MSAELPTEWSVPTGRPLVLAHRGANRHAPENTLEAFRIAHEQGADGFELDAMLCSDGVVVCHDSTLSRVTRGRRMDPLLTLTTKQLASVDLGGGHGVPSLDEVLRWAVARGQLVNVELKADQGHARHLARRAAACIESVPGASRHVVISSFHLAPLVWFHRVAPNVALGTLMAADQRTTRLPALLPWPPFAAVHPQRELVHVESVAHWKARGLRVHSWTIDDPRHARQHAELGVDAIITDDPALILSTLGAG